MTDDEAVWRWMGDPGDIGKALRNAAHRIHSDAAFIRRLRVQVGDHRDLPAEVEAALRVLTAWADQQRPGPPAPAAPKPPPVEPGPLAARPRPRQPLRRTRR